MTLIEQDPDRCKSVVASFPWVNAVSDLDEVIDRLDGVVIATRSGSHLELGLRALRAGKHALIEKPLATTLADAELLCSEAEANGVVLMAGHTFVFNPVVVELRRRIAAGDLGKIRYLRSLRLNLGLYQSDVNVLWDLAPHDISIMNYLLGDLPTTVSAWAHRSVADETEDVGMLRLQYEPLDVEAYISVSWLDPAKIREVTVVGSEKMAVYDDVKTEERLRIYDRGVEREQTKMHEPPMSYRYGDITSPYIDFDEPLALEDAHFVEAMRTGVVGKAGGHEGRQVVAVLEAAERSLATDRPVALSELLSPAAPGLSTVSS